LADGGQAVEHRVRCQPPTRTPDGKQRLVFDIDGKPKAVVLRIEGLTRALVSELPDWSLDLLEIAALVYGIDSAVSRGGSTLRQMGKAWYRRFDVEVPVRCLDLWLQASAKETLEQTLMALSDDRFHFSFVPSDAVPAAAPWFRFGSEDGWRADRVIMFSGGLDSLSGALEEMVAHGNRVALVSHFSSTKISKVQKDLVRDLRRLLGQGQFRHLRVQIQLGKGSNREGTHRTRSFLFAVLGLITATAFSRNRVSFHENGVVSLNLPPVGNVLSTRATRTTHPRTLALFSELFGHIATQAIRLDNPSFWKTKAEVMETISRLGGADLIGISASCADTHNRTTQHPHCGRCSQCIDRRFAALASGLDLKDPAEAYALDLMEGVRTDARDREIALSYVRNALFFETASPLDLIQLFPSVLQGLDRLGEPADTTLRRISELLARHGRAVTSVMRETQKSRPPDQWPDGSLPGLFGQVQLGAAIGLAAVPNPPSTPGSADRLQLVFDQKRKSLRINDVIEITGAATYGLLWALAEQHLEAAGQGLAPEDYPCMSVRALYGRLGLASDESLRKRVNRSRSDLRKRFDSAGLDPDVGDDLIENIPWQGYRLRPDLVDVRIKRDN
jgi:7-cyano-7-deazaguanine synthase in queuosine biosynthesis